MSITKKMDKVVREFFLGWRFFSPMQKLSQLDSYVPPVSLEGLNIGAFRQRNNALLVK